MWNWFPNECPPTPHPHPQTPHPTHPWRQQIARKSSIWEIVCNVFLDVGATKSCRYHKVCPWAPNTGCSIKPARIPISYKLWGELLILNCFVNQNSCEHHSTTLSEGHPFLRPSCNHPTCFEPGFFSFPFSHLDHQTSHASLQSHQA